MVSAVFHSPLAAVRETALLSKEKLLTQIPRGPKPN